jgi:hypothetical protein
MQNNKPTTSNPNSSKDNDNSTPRIEPGPKLALDAPQKPVGFDSIVQPVNKIQPDKPTAVEITPPANKYKQVDKNNSLNYRPIENQNVKHESGDISAELMAAEISVLEFKKLSEETIAKIKAETDKHIAALKKPNYNQKATISKLSTYAKNVEEIVKSDPKVADAIEKKGLRDVVEKKDTKQDWSKVVDRLDKIYAWLKGKKKVESKPEVHSELTKSLMALVDRAEKPQVKPEQPQPQQSNPTGADSPGTNEDKVEGRRKGDDMINLLKKIEENTRKSGEAGKKGKPEVEDKADDKKTDWMNLISSALPGGFKAIFNGGRLLAQTGAARMAGRGLSTVARGAGSVVKGTGSVTAKGVAPAASGIGKLATNIGSYTKQGLSARYDKSGKLRNAKGQFVKPTLLGKTAAKTREFAVKLGSMFKGSAEKTGTKVAGTAAKGVAAKSAANVAGKAVGKSLLKKIPVIGLLAGGAFAASRAMSGDWSGAGMELASGAASTIPGVGTAASIGIDAALAAKDAGMFDSKPNDTANKLDTVNQLGGQANALEHAKEEADKSTLKNSENNTQSVNNNNKSTTSVTNNTTNTLRIHPRNTDSSVQRYFGARTVIA